MYQDLFSVIIDPENLFLAWTAFRRGKSHKDDVMEFERELETHIFALHRALKDKTYRHGSYTDFYITDPKRRHVHKASVIDRVLHHAIVQVLTRIYEPTFIARSFSCRVGKGTHMGVVAARQMIRMVSKNNTHPCFVLKCDVRQFFATVDHEILLGLLRNQISDISVMWLLTEIINSFSSDSVAHCGLPIGNLTSQLFANVYMNALDQYMKNELRVKHYARYTDDFIVVSDDRQYLEQIIPPIAAFLVQSLKLTLHPDKVSVVKLNQGIDFLGAVLFPHHVQLRQRTQSRIVKKFQQKIASYNAGAVTAIALEQTLQSYLGVLTHTHAYHCGVELQNKFWFLTKKF